MSKRRQRLVKTRARAQPSCFTGRRRVSRAAVVPLGETISKISKCKPEIAHWIQSSTCAHVRSCWLRSPLNTQSDLLLWMASRCAYSNRQRCHLLPQRQWWARLLPRQRLSLFDYLNSLYIVMWNPDFFFNYQTYKCIFQQNVPGKLDVYCILANINRETLSSTNWMSHKCKKHLTNQNQVRKCSNKPKGATGS